MDDYSQTIAIPKPMRKILLPVLLLSILSLLIFLGVNYAKINLASLSGIITAWVTINPLEVDVSSPSEVEIGKVFKVEARVINKGEEKIENAKAEIFPNEGLVLIGKDLIQEIKVIPGKREKKVSWSVKGETIGNYVILVKASGELRGEVVKAEGSTLVIVKESFSRGGGGRWFQSIFEFFQEWF